MNYQLYVPGSAGYSDFRKAIEMGTIIIPKRELSLFEDFKNRPQNSAQSIVDLRVRNINSIYSTRLPEPAIVEITNYIINPDNHFDKSLEDGYGVIKALRKEAHSIKRKDGSPKDYLSFASKYCHHCRPNKFPIYDSVNVWAFTVLMGYKDQRDYSEFVKCFKVFCSEVINRVALDEDEGFYIDKYIQSIGSGGPQSVHGAE